MTNNSFPYSSIIDMLNKQAVSRSNEVYLLYPNQTDQQAYATLTYKQFNEVTSHLAQQYSIKIHSISTNQIPVVCLLTKTDENYLLTIYALLKLGVIVFPLSIRNSEAAIVHLLEKSNASHLFYSNEYASVANEVKIKFGSNIELYQLKQIDIDGLVNLGESTFKPASENNDLDKFCIIFHSSGSTSFPKPIRLTIRCMFGWIESFALEMNNRFWADDDAVLSVLPLFHILGMSISIMMWYVGGAYALPLTTSFPPSPKEIIASLQYPKITKLLTVTLMLEEIIEWLHQYDNIGFQALARLKFVIYGGACCSTDICNELIEHGVNVINMYGSTG
ncbi:unnamed protein product [Rotaria sp. Silwood1]|nr:unnamed protein product [Rotaria sp. Silwood1]CAF3708812.1 unnamed protein product [Rotaria sp. Silwood1]CAF5065553.1 unnamed protein product [Rotaria sp. Silwood1]